MTPIEAARILGVAASAPPEEVRLAYRRQIHPHPPARAGAGSAPRAAAIIEAYRVLSESGPVPDPPLPPPPPPPASAWASSQTYEATIPPRASTDPLPPVAPPVQRIDADTLIVEAPAEETFRWLLDAAHDIGEVTYVDRSMPIMEVLCRFEGEPATSLLLSLQGRGLGTEVFCTVESIEARPAPPTSAVVDLLELALHRRRNPNRRDG